MKKLSLKSCLYYAAIVILLVFGYLGVGNKILPFQKYGYLFIAGGLYMIFYAILQSSYYVKGTSWKHASNEPRQLTITSIDYVKTFISWCDAFKRTYVVEPGLYYTGDKYDRDTPLIVTANYLMTVLLVYRKARRFNSRILVIDTDGINVWCSAGKGRFSNTEIYRQIYRYDWNILSPDEKLTLILPKLSFSGVDITGLRKANLNPVIGPIHAKYLPEYLANPPYKDRTDDRFEFYIYERIFTWLPGLIQTIGFALIALILLWVIELITKIPVHFSILAYTAWIATAYPILFPWIPGRQFAIKGLWLAGVTSLVVFLITSQSTSTFISLVTPFLLIFATSLFFALSYTGNSPVSNYTRVRKEIARYLIPTAVLYLLWLVFYVMVGTGK